MAIDSNLLKTQGSPFPYEFTELCIPRFSSDGGTIQTVIWAQPLCPAHFYVFNSTVSWGFFSDPGFPGLILIATLAENRKTAVIEVLFLDLADEIEASPSLLETIRSKGNLGVQLNLVDAGQVPPVLVDYRIHPFPEKLVQRCLAAWQRFDPAVNYLEAFSDLMDRHTPQELWDMAEKY